MTCWFFRAALLALTLTTSTFDVHHGLAEAQSVRGREARSTSTVVEVDQFGTVHIDKLSVPYSAYASPESKAEFLKLGNEAKKIESKGADIAARRQAVFERFRPAIERTQVLYPVNISHRSIAGVQTDVFIPRDGITKKNKHRVLVELHGGGFLVGAHVFSVLESAPVASLGRIRVIAVNYRQAPEFKFPAASKDVAAVYRELLKTYKPRSIGIYGCSAGGILTAEALAWIKKQNLPTPGAIGTFCGAAALGSGGGDSTYMGPVLMGFSPPPIGGRDLYFDGIDIKDPLVQPVLSSAVLAQFPPTLIISSSRDQLLASAIYTHTQLTKVGVHAELYIWEGMVHGFFTLYPDIPESKEALHVITHFFDAQLVP